MMPHRHNYISRWNKREEKRKEAERDMKAQDALDEQSLVRDLTRTDVERSLAILSIARAESSSKSPLKSPSPSRKIDTKIPKSSPTKNLTQNPRPLSVPLKRSTLGKRKATQNLEKTVKRPKTKHGNKIESHVDDAGAATAQDDSVPPSTKPHTDSEIERSLSIPPVAIDCKSCLKTLPLVDFPQSLHMEHHKICDPCLAKYVTTEIKGGAIRITCPPESCSHILEHTEIKENCSAAIFHRYHELVSQKCDEESVHQITPLSIFDLEPRKITYEQKANLQAARQHIKQLKVQREQIVQNRSERENCLRSLDYEAFVQMTEYLSGYLKLQRKFLCPTTVHDAIASMEMHNMRASANDFKTFDLYHSLTVLDKNRNRIPFILSPGQDAGEIIGEAKATRNRIAHYCQSNPPSTTEADTFMRLSRMCASTV